MLQYIQLSMLNAIEQLYIFIVRSSNIFNRFYFMPRYLYINLHVIQSIINFVYRKIVFFSSFNFFFKVPGQNKQKIRIFSCKNERSHYRNHTINAIIQFAFTVYLIKLLACRTYAPITKEEKNVNKLTAEQNSNTVKTTQNSCAIKYVVLIANRDTSPTTLIMKKSAML